MDYFIIILPKLFGFLLLIATGYLISKAGVVKKEGLPTLSAFLIRVALPCLVMSLLFQRGTSFADLVSYRRVVLWQIADYFLQAGAGILCVFLCRMKRPLSNVHEGCMVGGNFGFIVIPLIMALFGPDSGQQYIPVLNAVDTIMVWTLGLALFTHGTEEKGKSGLGVILGRLINPIFVSIMLALILNSFHLTVPSPVLSVITDIGGVCSSMGLIYVGCAMCFMKKGNSSMVGKAFLIVLFKMLVLPALICIVSSRFIPRTESIVLMLTAGAPSMTTSCMIAQQYRLDEDYAASAVFLTTLLSLVTIPLLFLITAAVFS